MNSIDLTVSKEFMIKSFNGENSRLLKKGKNIVGRSHVCDIVLDSDRISAIHALIEITASSDVIIYDLHSANGTFVNGNQIVRQPLVSGDRFTLGGVEYIIEDAKTFLPPPPLLNILEKDSLPSRPDDEHDLVLDQEGLSIVYPLANDAKADYTEYIFEDATEILPIFKYEVSKSAIEVIIMIDDRVLSVDYIPNVQGIYSLKGFAPGRKEYEFPYLGKNDVVPLIEVSKTKESFIVPPSGYSVEQIGEDKSSVTTEGQVVRVDHHIYLLSQASVKIFVRATEAPPRVMPAPFFQKDKEFYKYLIIVMFFIFMFLAGAFFYKVDKEKEEEKVPERLATILYRPKLNISKNIAIEKTKKAPVKVQKSVKKPKEAISNKPKVKPTDKIVKLKSGSKKAPVKKALVKKVNPKKGPTNLKRKRVTRTVKSGSSAQGRKTSTRKSRVKASSKGQIETYKAVDFTASMPSLMAKGGSLKKARALSENSSSDGVENLHIGTGSATVKRAKMSNDVGSLVGAARGTVDSARGVEGLVNKKSVFTVGIPSRTIVLGSVDPDVIRRILMDHLDQFRSCYQDELTRSTKKFDGVVPLEFTAGASGHVIKAGLTRSTNIPSSVSACVINVLRGIKFPEPLGGGTYSVRQPMNFYPRD